MEGIKQLREVEKNVNKQEKSRREQREATDDVSVFASYTDPSRNIAVGDMSMELSGSFKKKKQFSSSNGSESVVAHRQAMHFMKKNNFECAFKFIEKARIAAIKEMEGHECEQYIVIISAEAYCLLKLGDFFNAKLFAGQVLKKNTSSEAQFVMAEALYNMCQFEHALVAYNQGTKLIPEIPGFHLGMEKCKETIINIIRRPDLFTFEGHEDFFNDLQYALKTDKDAIKNFIHNDTPDVNKYEKKLNIDMQ